MVLMSQVVFKLAANFVEVVGGWDARDKEFVLYIFNLKPNATHSLVWSNLCDFDKLDRFSTERLRARLERYLGFQPPIGFWERVERKEGPSVRYEWNGSDWYQGVFLDESFEVPMTFEVPIRPPRPSVSWLS